MTQAPVSKFSLAGLMTPVRIHGLIFSLSFAFSLSFGVSVHDGASVVHADCGSTPPCCTPQATCWHNCSCKQLQNGQCPQQTLHIPSATKRFYQYWAAWDYCSWCFQHPSNSKDAWKQMRPPPDWYPSFLEAESQWKAAGSNLNIYERGGVSSADMGFSMWDWCKWEREGLNTLSKGITEWLELQKCPCGIPQDWLCYGKTRTKMNGWMHWLPQGDCSKEAHNVSPSDIIDPVACFDCDNEGLNCTHIPAPTITIKTGTRHTTIHEMGHAIGLTHTSEPPVTACVPSNTILAPSPNFGCSPSCSLITASASDRTAVRFLYGP